MIEIFGILLIVGIVIKMSLSKKPATILCIKHKWVYNKDKQMQCEVCGKLPD